MDLKNLKRLAKRLDFRRTRVQSNNLVASCPFAPWTHRGNDSRPSFGILIDDEGASVFNCFGCKARGDLLQLVLDLADYRGDDYSGIEDWIWQNEGLATYAHLKKTETDPETWRLDLRAKMAAEVYDDRELEEFLTHIPAYAFERGFDQKTCEAWEIGDDPEKERMILPVRRMGDRALVGIKGRTYGDDRDKYLPYLPWTQSSFLFGEAMIREDQDKVVLVEGELDAIKVWTAGFTGLALMGSGPSRAQVRKLLLLDKQVVMLPDRDQVGADWANSLGTELVEYLSVLDARVPKGKRDPGEMTRAEIQKAVTEAKIRI